LLSANVNAHDLHVSDLDELKPIKTWYDQGSMYAEVEAHGILRIYKDGDMNHNQMHYEVIHEDTVKQMVYCKAK
jgi:hypothetical protein